MAGSPDDDPQAEAGNNDQEKELERIKREMEGKSTEELKEAFNQALATPEMQRLQEALTPRIYLTFTQRLEVVSRAHTFTGTILDSHDTTGRGK